MKIWPVVVALGILAVLLSGGLERLDEESACRARGLVLSCDVTCECAAPETHHGRP